MKGSLDWQERVRRTVFSLKRYVPGKPIEEVQRELGLSEVIKLASNENPLGPSPKAVAAAQAALLKANLYPEDSGYRLKRSLSKFLKVPYEWILLGRGSDELLLHAVLTFVEAGDEVVYAHPSFIIYEFQSTLAGAVCHRVPLQNFTHDLPAMAERVTEKTKLVFIANPNNPTGTIVKADVLDEFLNSIPEGVVVVLDEAYYEYVDDPDYPQTLRYVQEGRNVLVCRTFSKIYGLAGLRVGYGVAHEELAGYLNQVREPFNVSSIAQAAAEAALTDKEHARRSQQVNRQGKEFLYAAFEEMGLRYVPTQANFILVNVGFDSREVFHRLLRKGIIVRTGDVFELPTFLRVTIGTPEQNRRFVETLVEVLNEMKRDEQIEWEENNDDCCAQRSYGRADTDGV